MPVEPMHRAILAADIEGFGRLERSNPVRARLRAALHHLLDHSLTHASIDPWRREHTDHGDCVLVLLDPHTPKNRLLHPLVPKLAAALARHNRGAAAAERLRLRVVIAAGEILRDAHGHSGEDLNTAFRLLDSQPLHACLADAAGDLAVIVSDAIYQAIVKHGYRGIDPADYRPVTVAAKETNTTAWVHAPRVPARAPRPRAARAAASPPATVRREGPVTPIQLPGDVASFTGRRRELRRLRELLASTGRRSAAVVSAIYGIAGVGKSALAVRAAHALAAHFPDGQLYVDLRGASASGSSPLAPLEVLGPFLRALGVDGEDVPVELEGAVARFRSLLTGRRVLVVLDNAASAEQVRPLLPAAPGSAAIVTSRQALFMLEGAVILQLDVLSPKESVALLRRLAGTERVAAEPSVALTVALQCGCLPLALRIAGAALAARTFRLLGLLDGADVSIPVAAALVDQPPGTVETVLERLVDAQVLQSPSPGRYRLHDLLRLFAREKADQDERVAARRAALRRALRCYLATAQRANELVAPADLRRSGGGGAGGVALVDRRSALDWLETERGNLIAAARQAAVEPGPLATATVGLASALFWFLQTRGYWHDWENLNQLAVQVTRRLGDRMRESQALRDLAGAHHRLGRVDAAITCLEEALQIHRDLGNRPGEQAVLSNLGIAYRRSGRLEDAIASCDHSLEISRESGDRYGEAVLHHSIGQNYSEQQRFDKAITSYVERLSIFQELSDAYGQGNALANLGEVCCVAGRADEAVAYCTRSLTLFREVGDRSDEAEALWRLGSALDALGQRDQARASWNEALAIFEAIGAPRAKEVENLFRGDSPSL